MTLYVPTDLGAAENWRLRLKRSEYAPVGTEGSNAGIYPISLAVNTPVIAVGIISNMARAHWWLGAWCDFSAYTGAKQSTAFSPINRIETKVVTLNELTILTFPNVQPTPYWLKFRFPKWIKDIQMEVWEYIGSISSDEPEVLIPQLETQLRRIEEKIDNL